MVRGELKDLILRNENKNKIDCIEMGLGGQTLLRTWKIMKNNLDSNYSLTSYLPTPWISLQVYSMSSDCTQEVKDIFWKQECVGILKFIRLRKKVTTEGKRIVIPPDKAILISVYFTSFFLVNFYKSKL